MLHNAAFAGTLFEQYNSSYMAAGDAQRVWFPEMIEWLRAKWHQGMSCDALIELRDELDAQLQRIRSERPIRSPILKCPCCGHVGEGADPHVSVRAMILLAWSIRDRFCRANRRHRETLGSSSEAAGA